MDVLVRAPGGFGAISSLSTIVVLLQAAAVMRCCSRSLGLRERLQPVEHVRDHLVD
jgi:hypothetical protein